MRRQLAVFVALVALGALCARAEKLPVRAYTTADGLAQDHVQSMVQDSRGYLWFCTPEGLSLFDGHAFESFDDRHGIAGRVVHDLLETKDGRILVASGRGVLVLGQASPSPDERSTPAFQPLTPELADVHVLHEARDGITWCGLANGLAKLARRGDAWTLESVLLPATEGQHEPPRVQGVFEEEDGSILLATSEGIMRSHASAPFERVPQNGIASGGVRQLLRDRKGALWAARDEGLAVLAPNAFTWRFVDVAGARTGATCLLESEDGTLWVGTRAGLLERAPGTSMFRRHGVGDGLADETILSLAEDAAGTIWAGTEAGGALRISRHGFVTFGEDDGLGSARISQVIESDQGELVAVDSRGFLNVYDGQRFETVRPNLVPEPQQRNERTPASVLEDSEGEWWIPSSEGVCVFDRVPRVASLGQTHPRRRFTMTDGLGSNDVVRLFEDREKRVWVATASTEGRVLASYDRASESFSDVPLPRGGSSSVPTAFAEDAGGSLWIGLHDGSVLRTTAGAGAVVVVPAAVEASQVSSLVFDTKGRLWVALDQGGLLEIAEPASARPNVKTWSPANGLASWNVSCVVEGDAGRMWAGTARGLSRIDPESGAVDGFTIADGLGNSYVGVALRDRAGSFWFGTLRGLSRLSPMEARDVPPPRAWIRRLEVGGRKWSIPELGTDDVQGVVVPTAARRLDVEFAAVSLLTGEEPRYQWKLEGADSDWSPPSAQRSVTYDHLVPGSTRFLVRAIDAKGRAQEPPAQIALRVGRPAWQQWWVLILVAASIAGLGALIYSWRVDQLLELERVRTRIASDLHDDIGAGLTQVAILSEVARQRAEGAPPQVVETLERIALVSRELVDSMSDIVWAVDPRRDELSDLVHRMRRFASDVFTARGIDFGFETRLGAEALKVPADLRRQVFLIFKEAVNNVGRHSGCSKANVRLVQEGQDLVLTVEDDGVGFELSDEITGLGLGSLVTRARKMGGTLDVRSVEGEGTLVTLQMPLKRRTR